MLTQYCSLYYTNRSRTTQKTLFIPKSDKYVLHTTSKLFK